jgi:uncharacterized protein
MFELKGKTVIITGASGGIGRHMVREVSKFGANSIIIARSTDKLNRLKSEIEMQYDVHVDPVTLDMGDMDAVKKAFEKINLDYPTVDVLINNAGFGIFDYFEEAKLEDTKRMFDVNVIGLMTATRMLLPKMLQQGEGHIINIASIAGKLATPKSSVYSATKSAVLGFSNGLRMELAGKGIKVTTVNPGPIKTNFFNIADPSGTYPANVSQWMVEPEVVAQKVVAAIGTNRREVNLPLSMSAGARLYLIFPKLVEKIAGRWLNKK